MSHLCLSWLLPAAVLARSVSPLTVVGVLGLEPPALRAIAIPARHVGPVAAVLAVDGAAGHLVTRPATRRTTPPTARTLVIIRRVLEMAREVGGLGNLRVLVDLLR